jgi:hypothetical protein
MRSGRTYKPPRSFREEGPLLCLLWLPQTPTCKKAPYILRDILIHSFIHCFGSQRPMGRPL